MKPTPQQEAIYEAAALPQSLMIRAYAGTGKTTTIEGLAPHLPARPTLAVAFNKRIEVELTKRLPPTFTCRTLNGLGHRALAKAIGKRLIVEPNKIGGLVSDHLKACGYERASTELWTTVRTLVHEARNAGLVPRGCAIPAKGLVEDEPETWEEFADKHLFDTSGEVVTLAREVLLESIRQGLGGLIDYDDQIYLSTLFSGLYTKFGNVLVDEAQDLSPLNHIQLRKSLLLTSKLVVVGDPRQAIYAFRGADASSMDRIKALREEWIDLPLSVTFRCPKAIVLRQQEHAPGYTAAAANREGTVHDFSGPWQWSDAQTVAAGGSLAVLCRNNAPIISLAFKLIRNLVGVQVLGRDIGKNIASLLRKICGKDDDRPVDECLALIKRWADVERANARAKEKEEKIAQITDREECMYAVIDAGKAETLGEACKLIVDLFTKDGTVVLSTGHKAKGLEWNTVVHLDPWRIPSKWARRQAAEGNGVPLEQDLNLRYVIETRAQANLINANLDDLKEIP